MYSILCHIKLVSAGFSWFLRRPSEGNLLVNNEVKVPLQPRSPCGFIRASLDCLQKTTAHLCANVPFCLPQALKQISASDEVTGERTKVRFECGDFKPIPPSDFPT